MAKRLGTMLAKAREHQQKGESSKTENVAPSKAGDDEFGQYTKKMERFHAASRKHAVLAG